MCEISIDCTGVICINPYLVCKKKDSIGKEYFD